MYLNDNVDCENVNSIKLAHDRVNWRALLLAVLNLLVLLPESPLINYQLHLVKFINKLPLYVL
jgi:hypothetical protein